MRTHALRLGPGADLRRALEREVAERDLANAFVLTCVGSLREAAIRFAGRDEAPILQGPFEILSLVGTFAPGAHLHVLLGDREGEVIGGHASEGCVVHTTAEVVLGSAPDIRFSRVTDPQTGYPELRIDEDRSS